VGGGFRWGGVFVTTVGGVLKTVYFVGTGKFEGTGFDDGGEGWTRRRSICEV